jgi:hypothetical protein
MTVDPDRSGLDSPPALLELDHVFEALAHPRRRYLLYSLSARPEWEPWELARKVAAWEREESPDSLDEETIERVYVSLQHSHVPMLVENDIVEVDGASGTIRPGSNAAQVLSILENAGGSHDSEQESHAGSDRNEGHP